MNYKQILTEKVREILLTSFPKEGQSIVFEVSIPELQFGDLSCNVCLVASKILKMSPIDIFEKIEKELKNISFKNKNIAADAASHPPQAESAKYLDCVFEKVEFKNPGFVNFYLKEKSILESLKLKKEENDFKIKNKYQGQKILVEHTSVNLFKPFTVGHMMSNFIGEFIKNVYTFSGSKVINLSYPSDKSIGIAKAIFIIKQDGGLSQEIFQKDLQEIIKYLGQCYVRGVAEFKKWEDDKQCLMAESITRMQQVKNISNNIFNNTESEDLKIFEYAKIKNIEYFESLLAKLNSNFNEFIYESEAGEIGKKIVLENVGKVFEESEKAIIYRPDEDRKDIPVLVYVNSEGNPTYGAKDIGLIDLKFKKYNPDMSIYVVDNEQTVHFKSVFDAMSKINKKFSEKSLHVPHGRMTFKGARMSSRLGNVPTGEEILDAVVEEVKEKSGDKTKDLTDNEKECLYKEIALAALKITILRSKAGVNIDFDPDRATSFEGDSGPYLCYTYARCFSILDKSKDLNLSDHAEFEILEDVCFQVLRKVFQYENVLEMVVDELASQKLVTYLFELSGMFNRFYTENKIIDIDNLEQTAQRVFVAKKVSIILKHGLGILGIKAPERM